MGRFHEWVPDTPVSTPGRNGRPLVRRVDQPQHRQERHDEPPARKPHGKVRDN